MLRIGVHSIQPDGAIPALREALSRGVFFPLMKAVDGLGVLLEVFELEKEYDVEIVKIGRCTGRDVPPIELEMSEDEIRRLAENQMAWVLEKSEPYRHLPRLYWEVVNEPAWPELERHLSLCQFLMYCMNIAEGNGLKLALFSYSIGFPRIEWWPEIIGTGIFARAKEGGHILSLHEGTMGQDFFGEGVIPWLCHRYRFIYELLKEDEKIPLAITEFTLDYEACLPLLIDELVKARETEEERPEFRYDSGSILLPQGASWELWEALKQFIERYRPSILQSVHDAAAVSPYAKTHTVTAINPTEEVLEFLRKELNTD